MDRNMNQDMNQDQAPFLPIDLPAPTDPCAMVGGPAPRMPYARSLTVLFAAVAGTALFVAGCGGDKPAAEKVGEVSTSFNLFGNNKIVVESIKDPKIEGIVIHLSAAKTGGISGRLGLAEDTSDASIDAVQNGPVRVLSALPQTEEIFTESRSAMFKSLHITRFWDEENRVFVYLTHSDHLVDGSPKNSVSSVAPQSWDGKAPDLSVLNLPAAPAPRP